MPVRCTYEDCDLSFQTEKAMKYHKKNSDEHDYCSKCDEDFKCYEDYAQHKTTRPEEHGKACRVCGDEFKSDSGLKRHIELNHKIDQTLTCIGCKKTFYRACLFIEHLEFGHCDMITPAQFQGHVVHKHLITEFLKGGTAYERFKQKTSKFDASQDNEEEGGVDLGDPLGGDEDLIEVEYDALQPDTASETTFQSYDEPYPPLASTSTKVAGSSVWGMPSSMSTMSLSNTTFRGPGTGPGSANSASAARQSKAWKSRSGKSASKTLFPNAKPTPVTKEFSIAAHDQAMEKQHGINIMNTRFWDPMSNDWNPEKFYDSILNKYACPFICEQLFPTIADLTDHIYSDHRAARMLCPTCFKTFKSATALMAHCESLTSKCHLSRADDYNKILDCLSGGFLSVNNTVRPDHRENPAVMLANAETGRMEMYRPPVATYLEYTVSTPPDWKETEERKTVTIGGFPGKSGQQGWSG